MIGRDVVIVLGILSSGPVLSIAQSKAAFQFYTQGRDQWNKGTLDSLELSIDSFKHAIQSDPHYAMAYAGLADAYALLAELNVLPLREVVPKLQSAAVAAFELENDSAEVYTSLGRGDFYNWNWAGAEAEFKRALDLNPHYTTAHIWYSQLLVAFGRHDEAIEQLDRALEEEPLSVNANLAIGYRSYYTGRYPHAIEISHKVLAMDPQCVPAHVLLGRVYVQQRLYDAAAAEFREALKLSGGDTNELAALGYALALSGRESEARATLNELERRSNDTYVQPVWTALIYLALRDQSQALKWLEKAYADHSAWLVNLDVDPVFDDLRLDPHFVDLRRRVGLEPAQYQ